MPTQCVEKAPPIGRVTSVLSDTLVLGSIAGIAKLAGLAKSIAIARAFGSSPDLDHYLLAFLIPSVLADTFCGALVPVTVPRLIELDHRIGQQASHRLYRRLLGTALRTSLLGSAGIGLCIAAFLNFTSGFGANARPVALLALLMLPVIPCNALANVWRAVLNSQSKFAAPALTVLLTPVVITVTVLAASSWGAWGLAVATALGAAGEAALLAICVQATGFPLLPPRDFEVPSEAVNGTIFRKEYSYLVASGILNGGTVALGQVMASWLGPGSVSALNYGTRLSGVLLAIGPAAVGVAVLPRFSHIVADRDWDELRRSLQRVLIASIAVSAGAALLFILLSPPIVRLTLQHGAFTAGDTGVVARVQSWSLLQMPFIVGISIFMRVFSVLNANRVLLPLSAAALVTNLALNFGLMHAYGVSGISMASSIAQALLCAAMAWLVFGPSRATLFPRRAEPVVEIS